MAKPQTGTILKIYLLAKSRPGKEEGFIQLWKHKGKLRAKARTIPFDYLREVPDAIAAALSEANIKWPPRNEEVRS